ncbi:hypothetical protein ACIPX0_16145 [Streptomyces sp. NPDC090075]|uniref:hypothetical protein n=1 Tax=Streptomyces sp. NPDC090075 TaxID=3365937 RepID=UPI003809BAD7
MTDLLFVAGLAGALLCLAGRLPGSVHGWGPHLAALSGMLLMAGGRPLAGACATGAGCLWSAGRAGGARRGWTGVVDLAVMTLLMALMTGGGAHRHMASGAVGPAVLTVVVWVTARAGAIMFRSLSERPAPCAGRSRVCREAGAVLMVGAMAAMLV